MTEIKTFRCDICGEETGNKCFDGFHDVEWHGDMTGWGLGSDVTKSIIQMCSKCYRNFESVIKDGRSIVILERQNMELKKKLKKMHDALIEGEEMA